MSFVRRIGDDQPAAHIDNPHPVDLRTVTAAESARTGHGLAGSIGATTLVLLTLGIAGLPSSPVTYVILLLLILAGAAAGGGVLLTAARSRNVARAQVAEHHQKYGPRRITVDSLADPALRTNAARAIQAHQKIRQSPAVLDGALGAPADAIAEAARATWSVAWSAQTVDQLILADRSVAGQARERAIPGEAIALERAEVQAEIRRRRAAVNAAADKLDQLALQVAELDARRSSPAAQAAFRDLLPATPLPAESTTDSADALAARIDAAGQVLDAGGYTPPALN